MSLGVEMDDTRRKLSRDVERVVEESKDVLRTGDIPATKPRCREPGVTVYPTIGPRQYLRGQ